MPSNTGKMGAGELSLGRYLAAIRDDRGLTLRQVEEATKKQVSNAYLSQIENGHIQKPSPNILHALAELYAISFEGLMDKAGFFTTTHERAEGERHGRIATFAEHNLEPQEEAELIAYLKFIRSRKRSGDESR